MYVYIYTHIHMYVDIYIYTGHVEIYTQNFEKTHIMNIHLYTHTHAHINLQTDLPPCILTYTHPIWFWSPWDVKAWKLDQWSTGGWAHAHAAFANAKHNDVCWNRHATSFKLLLLYYSRSKPNRKTTILIQMPVANLIAIENHHYWKIHYKWMAIFHSYVKLQGGSFKKRRTHQW